MISFTSIITAIKGASIATKIGLGIGATAIVAGGAVGAVMIINNASHRTAEEQQIVSEKQDEGKLSSDQNDTQNEGTGASKDDTKSDDQATNDKRSDNANGNSQSASQKPTANSSTSSKPNNTGSSSSSKPSTPAPTQPTEPAQPNQPSQPTQPTKKPDYNLNDRYVAGYETYPFYTYDPNGPDLQQCTKVEEKSFFAVVKFSGGGELFRATCPKYLEYAKSKGYNTYECLGMGSAPTTWEAVVEAGLALDEAKCQQYGLSCGRW